MRLLKSALLFAVLFCASTAPGQDAPRSPEEALSQARKAVKEGSNLLRQAGESEGEQGALARKALKLFEQAQKLYEFYVEKAGTSPKIDDEISHVQSLIYWSRKMTPMASEEEDSGGEKKPAADPEKDLPGGEDMPPPPAPAPEEKKPEASDLEAKALELLRQAEKYEKENPEDFFDISVMYFKVVDQYRGTSSAAAAMGKCLEYQRRHLEKTSGGRPAPVPDKPRKEAAAYEPPAEPTLIRLNLRHPDAEIRARNVEALVLALGKKCMSDLHGLFLVETDTKVVDAVIKALAGFKDPSTLKFAKKHAADRDSELASKVMRLAAALGKPDCARIIMIAVAVNADPVHASGRPINTGFVEPYARKVQEAFGAGIRAEALKALGGMGEEGITGLRSCLKSRSLVAREAILCLGMLKDHKSSGYVGFYLQRNNVMAFRSEAMAALFIIGIDAVPYLIKYLDNPALRIWCAYQLREMTGQPFTASAADRWWAWYNQNKKK